MSKTRRQANRVYYVPSYLIEALINIVPSKVPRARILILKLIDFLDLIQTRDTYDDIANEFTKNNSTNFAFI